jgi:hypothetical protein
VVCQQYYSLHGGTACVDAFSISYSALAPEVFLLPNAFLSLLFVSGTSQAYKSLRQEFNAILFQILTALTPIQVYHEPYHRCSETAATLQGLLCIWLFSVVPVFDTSSKTKRVRSAVAISTSAAVFLLSANLLFELVGMRSGNIHTLQGHRITSFRGFKHRCLMKDIIVLCVMDL